MATDDFAEARERELVAEAELWDVSTIAPATHDDIPVLDVSAWRASGDPDELDALGDEVRVIGEEVGFHFLTGHGIDPSVTADAFAAAKAFLTLPDDAKLPIRMDTPDTVVPGAGYLPVGERKLPRRSKGNLNEAIIFEEAATPWWT